VVRQLESLWEQGQRPDPDALLAAAGVTSPREVAAVLAADQWQRWHAGERVAAEDYLARHPGVAADAEAALVLVYGEFLSREELGEKPSPNEYVARFPRCAEGLRRQLDFHAAVAEGSPTFVEPEKGPGKTVPPRPLDNASNWPSTNIAEKGPGQAMSPLLPAVPGYELLREIGRGGMGIVYLARHTRLDRPVALKMILAGGHAGEAHLGRFQTEAHAIARLNHPNIVQIYEVGEHGGLPFFSLEFCSGGSLENKLLGKPLPPKDAAALVEKLARGMHSAHEKGIIHRDLKPDNVLLSADGTPKITDFGLARMLDDVGQTHTGAVFGTPSYMAPEQARGSKNAKEPADVYALGAILYECLTGRPPFRAASSDETLLQLLFKEAVPPQKLNAQVPRDLETICLKCLRKEPDQRYATALELAEDLRRFHAGEPIQARPIGSVRRSLRWCRRNPRLAGLLATVAALLVVIAAGASVAALWLKSERDRAVQAEAARIQDLYRASLNEARARRATGQLGQRLLALDAIRKLLATVPRDDLTAEQVAELRDEVVACLALPDLREVVWRRDLPCLATDGALDAYALLDPARDALVVKRWSDPACEVRLDGGHAKWIPPRAYFSPDGRWLAELRYVDTGWGRQKDQLRVWDWQARKRVLEMVLPLQWGALAFDADNRRLAVGSPRPEGKIHLFDLHTRSQVSSPARFDPSQVVFAPAGRQLAVANNDWVEIVEVETWKTVVRIPNTADPTTVAWSPDGAEIAVGNINGEVYLWNVEAHAGRFLAGRHHGRALGIEFVGAGGWLASWGTDDVTLLWGRNRDRPALQLRGWVLRGSSDGRRLAMRVDHDFHVYESIDAVGRSRPLSAEFAEFDPGGRWLAVSGFKGVQLLAADTLEKLDDLLLDPCGPAAFRPDGKELITFGLFSQAQRWPIVSGAAGGAARVGPPVGVVRKVGFDIGALVGASEPQRRGKHAAWSRDGKTLVLADYRGNRILITDPREPTGVRRLTPWREVHRVASSPDGAWVAGAAFEGNLGVWRASGGPPVLEVPGHRHGVFTADGEWLVTGARQEFRVYRAGTWELKQTITREDITSVEGAAIAVSPRLIALATSSRKILLLASQGRQVVATLTHAEPGIISWLSFDPGGARLAVTRSGRDVVVWDLRLLNEHLAELGLESPALAASAGQAAAAPAAITVQRGTLPAPDGWAKKSMLIAWEEALKGNFSGAVSDASEALQLLPRSERPQRARILEIRGTWHLQNGYPEAARDDWQEALALVPNLPEPTLALARLFVLGPSHLRNPRLGLLLGWAASEQQPDSSNVRLILGIALTRNNRYREALETLAKVAAADRGALGAYYSAVCKAHLGDAAGAAEDLKAARAKHDLGARSWSARQAEELLAARQEAKAALAAAPR
jgi:WD40 repeat protein